MRNSNAILPDNERLSRASILYILSLIFVVLAVLAMSTDISVGQFFLEESSLPGDLQKAMGLAEIFAHGLGVLLITVAILVLDRSCKSSISRILACAFGAGLVTHVFKLVVARSRPNSGYLPDTVAETFHGWLPWLEAGWHAESTMLSFPSGHTGMAVGLGVALAWRYPHGKWLFAFCAFAAAMQRIVSASHFPSDVCAGAALAFLWCGLCFDRRVFGRIFDRLEAKDARIQAPKVHRDAA